MGKIVGYARMSVLEHELHPQVAALRAAGVEEGLLFTDDTTSKGSQWEGLDACLAALDAGDTLIVWKIDRVGKSVSHLLDLFQSLHGRGIFFRSLSDVAIDTTGEGREIITEVFACLARFGRRLLQERAQIGIQKGRARGRQGGRRPIASSDPRVRTAKAMSLEGNVTVNEICSTLRISRATYYRYLGLEDG